MGSVLCDCARTQQYSSWEEAITLCWTLRNGLWFSTRCSNSTSISLKIKALVQAIRTEMKPELIPIAEDKSNFGKIVKRAIREMWALEYEVDELQHKFADSIGKMDLDNLDVDFIEDMM